MSPAVPSNRPALPPRTRWHAALVALVLLGCDPLREWPDPVPPVLPPTSSPPELTVTLDSTEPVRCRAGEQVVLSATVTGGEPERVEVVVNGSWEVAQLAAPYRYSIDCSSHSEGTFTFQLVAHAGGRTFPSPGRQVVVDRTPPFIIRGLQTTPFPSTSEVPTLVFSEPIDSRSLRDAPTTMRNDGGFSVAHQAVLSADGTVLRLIPVQLLVPPVTLHMQLLQTDFTDLAGNPIQLGTPNNDFSWQRTYWPFAEFEPQQGPPRDGGWSDFAFGWSDRPTLAFTERAADESGWELAVTRWNGSTWERLPPPRGADEREERYPRWVRLAVGPGSTLVLAWSESHGDGEHVHAKRYDGAAWQTLGGPMKTQSGYGGMTQLRLAMDGDQPVLMWDDWKAGVRVLRWSGTEWTPLGEPLSVSSEPAATATRPALSVGSRIRVAWLQRTSSNGPDQIWLATFVDGAWDIVPGPLPTAGLSSSFITDVALPTRSVGEPMVAWTEHPVGVPDQVGVYLSRWRAPDASSPKEWTAPETVQATAPGVRQHPVFLEVDWDGHPRVAWVRKSGQYTAETVYRRRRSTGWDPEQLVVGDELYGFRLGPGDLPWFQAAGGMLLRPQ